MHGISRTPNTLDLNTIFFKIRETRCLKTRRSWQRRARLALAKRDDLTPAERHEICSVWSRSNVSQIDSPAMSKLLKKEHRPQPHQTINAKSCTRRATGIKKPSERGLIAANDDVFTVTCTFSRTSQPEPFYLRHQSNCRYLYAIFQYAFPQSSGYIYQRFHRGSDAPPLLYCGNLSHRHHQHEQTHSLKPSIPKPPKLPCTCESFLNVERTDTVTGFLANQLTRTDTLNDFSTKTKQNHALKSPYLRL